MSFKNTFLYSCLPTFPNLQICLIGVIRGSRRRFVASFWRLLAFFWVFAASFWRLLASQKPLKTRFLPQKPALSPCF